MIVVSTLPSYCCISVVVKDKKNKTNNAAFISSSKLMRKQSEAISFQLQKVLNNNYTGVEQQAT